MTTFTSHKGLYQYKRLLFGISSAPELYQHIIQQVLADCEDAENISDDVIIHGSTKDEHDERLLKVLTKIKSAGLTLNRDNAQIDIHGTHPVGRWYQSIRW